MERWNKKSQELDVEQTPTKIKFHLVAAPLAVSPAAERAAHEAEQEPQHQVHEPVQPESSHQTDTPSEMQSEMDDKSVPQKPAQDDTPKRVLPVNLEALGYICLLCQRKFSSFAHLDKHKQLSEMHKQNTEIARVKQVARLKDKTKQQIKEKEAQQNKQKKKKAEAEERKFVFRKFDGRHRGASRQRFGRAQHRQQNAEENGVEGGRGSGKRFVRETRTHRGKLESREGWTGLVRRLARQRGPSRQLSTSDQEKSTCPLGMSHDRRREANGRHLRDNRIIFSSFLLDSPSLCT